MLVSQFQTLRSICSSYLPLPLFCQCHRKDVNVKLQIRNYMAPNKLFFSETPTWQYIGGWRHSGILQSRRCHFHGKHSFFLWKKRLSMWINYRNNDVWNVIFNLNVMASVRRKVTGRLKRSVQLRETSLSATPCGRAAEAPGVRSSLTRVLPLPCSHPGSQGWTVPPVTWETSDGGSGCSWRNRGGPGGTFPSGPH